MRHMFCTPTPLSAMPSLLQEYAGRWCHQLTCLVLTIEVYGSDFFAWTEKKTKRLGLINFLAKML